MESLRTFPRWIHSFPFPRLKFLISFPSSRAQLDLSARHYVRFDLWKHTTNLFLAFLLPFYLYIYIYFLSPRRCFSREEEMGGGVEHSCPTDLSAVTHG